MTQEIDIRLIEPNKGQIPGVPANPRVIKDHKYDLLKKSIQDDPEMLKLREVLVFEQEGKFICIGGNMRYRVCKDLGYETIPCKVIPEGTSPEKLKAYTIKDNASFGEWDMDMLANEWDIPDLINWGCDVENFEAQQEPDEAEEDDFDLEEEIPEVAITQPGDIWILGRHRLLCGDATKKEDVAKLMNDRRADMVLTDPPYNVNYEGGTGKKIQNDNMGDSAFFEFLKASFFNMANHLKAGGSYYIWHADSEGLNFRAACKAVGLQVRQCLIWKKNSLVLGRQDYQWIHEPCQIPGTKVTMEGGEQKNIEDIQAGDRIVGLEKASLQLTGWRKAGTGKIVNAVTSRHYKGNLYWIGLQGHKTNATDNHKFTVRYNAKEAQKYFVYIMKRGDWWRIGISQLRNSRGSGMRDRLRGEKGEAMWVVSQGFSTMSEAMVLETAISCRYGIPQTVWTTDKCQRNLLKSDDQIERIYELIGREKVKAGAIELLGDRINHPQIVRGDGFESTRSGFQVAACNLMPMVYEVLMPVTQETGTIVAAYRQIETMAKWPYNGIVHSMAVAGEHYISDGIVTHNCLYGWKDGAAHYFINDRTNTTLWEDQLDVNKMSKDELKKALKEILEGSVPTTIINEDKPSRSAEHPTMKPIKLMGRLIKNSSKKDDIILDLFGGSGSTLIAADQLNRICYTSEIDPIYCDVIVKRWEKQSQKKARRLTEEE